MHLGDLRSAISVQCSSPRSPVLIESFSSEDSVTAVSLSGAADVGTSRLIEDFPAASVLNREKISHELITFDDGPSTASLGAASISGVLGVEGVRDPRRCGMNRARTDDGPDARLMMTTRADEGWRRALYRFPR